MSRPFAVLYWIVREASYSGGGRTAQYAGTDRSAPPGSATVARHIQQYYIIAAKNLIALADALDTDPHDLIREVQNG